MSSGEALTDLLLGPACGRTPACGANEHTTPLRSPACYTHAEAFPLRPCVETHVTHCQHYGNGKVCQRTSPLPHGRGSDGHVFDPCPSVESVVHASFFDADETTMSTKEGMPIPSSCDVWRQHVVDQVFADDFDIQAAFECQLGNPR